MWKEQKNTITMKVIRCIILFCMLCLNANVGIAADGGGEMRNITSLDGMAGESVFRIFHDGEGAVWLGTNKGVCRYNGNSIENLSLVRSEELGVRSGKTQIGLGFKGGMVSDFCEMGNGELLVAMKSGVYRVDRERMTLVRILKEIERPNALCVVGDTLLVGNNEGVVVVRSEELGVRSEESTIIRIENSVISKNNIVHDIEADGRGGAWLCTNKQIVRIDLGTMRLTKYDVDKDLLMGNLRKICLVGNWLYIATYNSGLLRFDTATKVFDRCGAVDANVIADIRKSADGADGLLYVATDGKGAFVVDTEADSVVRRIRATATEGLVTDAVYTFVHDEESGTDWFGYYLDGFSHTLRSEEVFGVYRHGGLDSEQLHTRSFCINGGDIVIGTRNGLWFVSEPTGMVRYFGAEEIGGSIVTNIKYFGGKYVIANFERGLSVLDPKMLTVSRLTSDTALENGNFCKLCISPDSSRLFAISNMGVAVLDAGLRMERHFDSHNSELPDAYLTDIMFDSSGKAWISSMECMSIYDPATNMVQSSGFLSDYFNNEPNLRFCPCDDGDMIAIGENRVYKSRADMSAFEEIDLYGRLNVGSIAFIFSDEDYYWVGTDKGLFLFDTGFKNYRHYNGTDNLPSLRFNKQEYQQTADGRIWFATTQGLIYTTRPADSLWSDKGYGCSVVIDRLADKDIEVGWNFRSGEMAVKPVMPDYGHVEARFFEWAMDGDSCYTTISDDGGMLRVGNLSPGSHWLRIRLAGREETMGEWRVVVLPTWLFYMEMLLVVIIAVMMVRLIRVYKRRLQLRQRIKAKHRLDVMYAASQAVDRHKREEAERQRAEAEERERNRYRKSRLSGEESDNMYALLCKYMEENKPYRDSQLRISDLAKATGCQSAKLSQLLNQYAKQTFFEFVNTYRVEEFKRMIQNEEYQNYTVTAIAEMCGFKRSSFFTAFKQAEGCTPTEYVRKVRSVL